MIVHVDFFELVGLAVIVVWIAAIVAMVWWRKLKRKLGGK